MTPHPAVQDWLEIVSIREQRWKDAVAQNDPSAASLLSSLEVARKRLAAAIKYAGQPKQNSPQPEDKPRPTAW